MSAEPRGGKLLGLPSATALVIANMVGSGVFATAGYSLASLGSRGLVLSTWAVGGVIALLGAWCYGDLIRRHPDSGGEYLFLSRSWHPLAGFLAGWVSLLAGFTAPIAAAALLMHHYLGTRWGVFSEAPYTATAVILICWAMHAQIRRVGVTLQNVAVALKILVIGGFLYSGMFVPSVGPGPTTIEAGGLGDYAVSLVYVSFAYSGWNAAIYVAAEVRDSARTVARALLLGTGCVVPIYFLLNAFFLHWVPVEQLAGKPEVALVVAQAVGTPRVVDFVSAVVALALFTSVSAMIMAGPRVYARMAADGLFPKILEGSRAAPTAAVSLQCVLAIAVVWLTGLQELLGYIGFTLSLSTAACVALLTREGAWWRRALAAAFVIINLAIAGFLISEKPVVVAAGLVTLGIGALVYFLFRRSSCTTAP